MKILGLALLVSVAAGQLRAHDGRYKRSGLYVRSFGACDRAYGYGYGRGVYRQKLYGRSFKRPVVRRPIVIYEAVPVPVYPRVYVPAPYYAPYPLVGVSVFIGR